MNSHITQSFRESFAKLSATVQAQAKAAYRRWRDNPSHPSLHFKPVRSNADCYSVRIGQHYRAVAVKQDDHYIWFWIGSHSVYDKLLRRL